MLRLPRFGVAAPTDLPQALALLEERGTAARVIAGGTDLLPNLKHRIETPELLISLAGVRELSGIAEQADGSWLLGATTRLVDLACHEGLRRAAPALAEAAACVASPQIRNMATLGGNILLDTRCRYINQTHFWRQALGYCLKKDGTVCHVVAGGKKCVAAASSDTVPALYTLGATVLLQSSRGTRELGIDALYRNDGIKHTNISTDELLVSVRIPAQATGHRGAYEKLRDRAAIDFPELGVAVRLDVDAQVVKAVDIAVTALQARPRRVTRIDDILLGKSTSGAAFRDAAERAAQRAFEQCHPMPNVPGDSDYRQEMVRVLAKRALLRAAG
ncbi:MAG: FAD binding domain-containing protein [Polyangiaceae bacterium]